MPASAVVTDRTGFCGCGCGAATRITRGEPARFISGHNTRLSAPGHVVDPVTGCWIYQGFLSDKGYGGPLESNGKPRHAHIAYYERYTGKKKPPGNVLVLDHTCRNPSCVNPEHLELVTNAVNIRRGLSRKLSDEQVAEIKAADLSRRGALVALARKIGVSHSLLSMIRRGKRWAA